MYRYVAYGLEVHSMIALPELITSDAQSGAKARIDIRLGVPLKRPSAGVEISQDGTFEFWANAVDDAWLSWRNVGTFRVRHGREILISPVTGVDERVIRLFLLGPIIVRLLHQRGLLVLHAGAVVIDGTVAVFMGGPGWGKSTMAAILYNRGHGVLADDAVALDPNGPVAPTAMPGFPQLKLWPESVTSLGDAISHLSILHPESDKRARRVEKSFPQRPLPLRCIYLLDHGESIRVDSLSPQEAFIELVRHSHCIRSLQEGTVAKHFLQCAELLNKVPVRRLQRPRSLAVLAKVAQALEDDLNGLVS